MGTAFSSCTNEKRPLSGLRTSVLPPSPQVPSSTTSYSNEVRDATINRSLGKGGLSIVEMVHASGAKCEVYLFGATIISYENANGDELLYVNSDSSFDGRKAIQGGIPIVFPCFGMATNGNPSMPLHGFARVMTWTVGTYHYMLYPLACFGMILTLSLANTFLFFSFLSFFLSFFAD